MKNLQDTEAYRRGQGAFITNRPKVSNPFTKPTKDFSGLPTTEWHLWNLGFESEQTREEVKTTAAKPASPMPKAEAKKLEEPVIEEPTADFELGKELDAAITGTAPNIDLSKGKRIEKYSRYIMMADGRVFNSATCTELEKKEFKNALHVRLTSDTGKREYVNTEELHKVLFQPDIEQKTKKTAKAAIPAKLSKSQTIYFLHREDSLTIKEIVTANPSYNEGHVRNVIKDYDANPEKYERAKKTRALAQSETSKAAK